MATICVTNFISDIGAQPDSDLPYSVDLNSVNSNHGLGMFCWCANVFAWARITLEEKNPSTSLPCGFQVWVTCYPTVRIVSRWWLGGRIAINVVFIHMNTSTPPPPHKKMKLHVDRPWIWSHVTSCLGLGGGGCGDKHPISCPKHGCLT